MNRVRCAIYMRKSSDEGLEQDINSLDAQHEACAAYVLSQASEGWTPVSAQYDDGGLSGGTLERAGAISNTPVLIKEETYGPDLAQLQRLFLRLLYVLHSILAAFESEYPFRLLNAGKAR